MNGEKIEEIFCELFIENFAAVENFEEPGDFVGSGDVFAAFCSGFDVHHFAAKAGVSQAEGVEKGIDVVHADSIDEDVGHGIVGDGDHKGGNVAKSEFCYARSKSAGDAAAADKVGFLESVDFVEIKFALLGLTKEFSEDGDFDGAGGGKDFVGVQSDGVG